MTDDLMRVAYVSLNMIEAGQDGLMAEINRILATSQTNNRKVGITGALVFNRGFFGQILEGPPDAVEDTFERIQNDERHADVRLLEAKPIPCRSFESWAMGFVGNETALERAFDGLARDAAFDMSRIGGDDMVQLLTRLALDRELVDMVA